jgi:hypothetical protein
MLFLHHPQFFLCNLVVSLCLEILSAMVLDVTQTTFTPKRSFSEIKMQAILAALILVPGLLGQSLTTTCTGFNSCVAIHQEHQRETCGILGQQNATLALECKCHYDARLLACYDQCPNEPILVQERPAMEAAAQAVCQPLGLNYRALPQGSWVKAVTSTIPTATSVAPKATNAASSSAPSPSSNVKSDAHKVSAFSLAGLVGIMLLL